MCRVCPVESWQGLKDLDKKRGFQVGLVKIVEA
jgi:hypothetical protein